MVVGKDVLDFESAVREPSDIAASGPVHSVSVSVSKPVSLSRAAEFRSGIDRSVRPVKEFLLV